MHTELENINIDDTVLVEQCRRGNTDAMERLIIKYQDRIYSVILRICANRDDAVELTQDTFVKVIENINSFREKSAFYTWLFRIAVNLTLNHCKRRVRFETESLDAELGGAGTAYLRHHTRQRRLVVVVVEAEAAVGDATGTRDMGRLDHDQRGTAIGQHTEMDQVPVVGAAIVGRELAHGRNHQAVGEIEAGKPEG